MSWYRTGTVAVTNGSKTVTGVGTLFTTAVNVGDAFALVDANLNPTGAWYEVDAVVSNMEITLKQSYAGTTGSNNQYCVFNMVGNMTTPSFAQRLATFFASFQSLIDKPTTTPTALGIPVADANGDIDSGWLKDASSTTKGIIELATPAEVLAGTDTERAVTVKDLDYSYATLDSDRIYNGVNLEVKHAAEIAGYSDVWAWIKARITAVDYSGLHVGDYIPFTMNGHNIKAQIAGIDTYREYGDVPVGHHIDFVSKDCYPVNVLWNTTNVNNGSAANAAPWMVSNIKSVLNTTWYGYLPAALQAQIIEKRLLIETRYSSGSTLTDSTSWAWNDVGKLWVPSEFEVYGGIIWGTKGYSQNGSVQYPVFAGNSEKRVKNQGDGGDRCHWWLLSVHGGNSTYCCRVVGDGGHADYTYASHAALCAPVCFRIG